MKIKDIKIRNFRNIESLEILDISHSLALFGLNGQGKSSVLEAIRMTLLGECELSKSLSKHGVGGTGALVLDGAKEAVIKVTVDIVGMGELTAELTIPRKGKTT